MYYYFWYSPPRPRFYLFISFLQYYSAAPSDCTVGKPQAEIRTRSRWFRAGTLTTRPPHILKLFSFFVLHCMTYNIYLRALLIVSNMLTEPWAFTHFLVGWSDLAFLGFSKLGTLLSLRYIFRSSLPKKTMFFCRARPSRREVLTRAKQINIFSNFQLPSFHFKEQSTKSKF